MMEVMSRFGTSQSSIPLILLVSFLLSACSAQDEHTQVETPEDVYAGDAQVSSDTSSDPREEREGPAWTEPAGPEADAVKTDTSAPSPCEQCLESETCENDVCIPACIPDCDGLACGDDGCGGLCGICSASEACIQSKCVPLCTDCEDNSQCPEGFLCSSDPLGVLKKRYCAPPCNENESCPTGMECPAGASYCVSSPALSCYENDIYAGNLCGDIYWINEDCPPDLPCSDSSVSCACPEANCAGRECGTNGCATGNCGVCQPGETCVDGQCCISNCSGKVCGEDGCGRICGLCLEGDSCSDSGQCCTPQGCGDQECGLDDFGCPCGSCGPLGECINGQCACEPDCDGKSCGSDGCGGSCGCCMSPLDCIDGQCAAGDTCGGCPEEFECKDGGRCERPAATNCLDVIADQVLTLQGQCDDVHTIRFCENDTEVILSCLAPEARRRGGEIAKGALWCDQDPGSGLYDCLSSLPCTGEPCGQGPDILNTGCPQGSTCEDGTCAACTPECTNLSCGTDGCGLPCGTCLGSTWSGDLDLLMPPELCSEGNCLCTPFCMDVPFPCGMDGCGGSCGFCPEGDMWACSEERTCVCSPVCEAKDCGPDLCEGACGPSLPMDDTLAVVVPGLSQCPGSSICGEESQLCESPQTGDRCNGPSGLPIVIPETTDILGFGPADPLPPVIGTAVESLLNQGNLCATTCSQPVSLRDALIYFNPSTDPDEEESDFPDSWEKAHITLRVLLDTGEDAWTFSFQLDGATGTVEGTDFKAAYTAQDTSSTEFTTEAINAIIASRNEALTTKAGGSGFASSTLPETGIFSTVSWGCDLHHRVYRESFTALDSELSIILDLASGMPLYSSWVVPPR